MDDLEEENLVRHRIALKETALKRTTKKFLILMNNIDTLSYDECYAQYQGLLKELATFEFGIKKAKLISETNEREMNKYHQTYAQREEAIAASKAEIAQLRTTLAAERIARQNKEQYAQLAKLIHERPPTNETEKEIEVLHGELAELTANAAKTNQKLEYRTKQFQLLLHALQDLQTDLTAETVESAPSEDTEMTDANTA
eukprot:Phypoly_transcript_05301.p2 GENE.Phypoly_transcript_05301~~Phypoly_transcript_05301.p2  ORF type:complete len:200 (-),score=33.42 Phypoly_transcript_05301:81-680(-)